jgi:hypothetical protein
MANWWNGKTVEMEIGRDGAHHPAGAGVGGSMGMRVHGRGTTAARVGLVGQGIGQVKNNQVAGMHP